MGLANDEVIIRMVGKLTLEFTDIDQLKVRRIIEEVLYKYDVVPQETGLTTSGDTEDKLQIYLVVKKLEGLSITTLKNYNREILKFANYLRKPLATVTSMDIRMYLAQRCKNLKPSTTNTQSYILKSFFSWLLAEEYIPKNPMLTIKATKERGRLRHALTVDEVEILRQKCKSIREKALLEFTYSSGCRLSEIVDINKEDIDWHNKTLKVIGKGNKERIVCFNTKARYLLREYILSRADNNPALFVTSKGKHNRLGGRSIEREIKNIAIRADLGKSIYPHLLRHSIATHLLAAGMALHNVQALLGHSDPKTTQIYAETSLENVVYEYKRIS
ncbi:site-specific tyrosine recombinase/integron integrase [Clostridium sp. CF012]|uniref:site-specific tyrosine recombinase/integron integrase n=1 Tax=Clostridium sp. CF012 TaxID=2843319 RepID=UPI001C0BAD97|nr:site-specific tyrosine recombinase/integron integrase [Clostridium sp. CF012]MBU3145741.1 tyrosine-type recombinase/integrase [Clostridium sp. CF012]